MAYLIPGFQDFTAAFAQAVMVQTEHPREKAPIGASEERGQCSVSRRDGNLLGREQRVLVALAAASLQLFTILLQDRPKPHAAVVMQEVERRVVGDTE